MLQQGTFQQPGIGVQFWRLTKPRVVSRYRAMVRFCHTFPDTASPSSRNRAGGSEAMPVTSTFPAGAGAGGGRG